MAEELSDLAELSIYADILAQWMANRLVERDNIMIESMANMAEKGEESSVGQEMSRAPNLISTLPGNWSDKIL